ncbi:MAG: hypothetical protein RID15_07375 [Marinovum algicola]|jgi:hypothetical protein|uniref:Uncharacterized protein n=1 Tax=Marinovum algicola TaxID=42444 RepID=A0A975ZLV8_9RHOB|nr:MULTISPECIES: hypothetical protein [Marinovum]MDD9741192.1 hypothetical protein [Marinovum sp. SP66]MDD9743627.1 hypothetical protein [Marinovum sp. PR37]SEI54944.1 hypothetical protein SAMN04487940_101193 [Marinovum algicola]SLN28926.1 hypothetical protein MAA5396_01264 [Marinovum algicola]
MSALGWIAIFLAVWLALSATTTGIALPDPMALLAAVLLLLVALLAVYRWRGEVDLLRMLRRGGMVLLPILLAALVPIVLVFSGDGLDVRLRQAALAGLIIVTGWLATFIFQEERRQRDRSEQELDLLMALRSEVFTIVEKLDKHPITRQAEEVERNIAMGGDDPTGAYFPFSASESPATVYDAVSGQLHVINAATLEPVLRFYAAFSELGTMVADTHRAEFPRLEARRRITLHKELTQQRRATLYWGLRALEDINLKIGVPNPEAIPRSGKNEDVTL